jgi:putative transposase
MPNDLYHKANRSVYSLNAHIVLVTKSQKKILNLEMIQRLEEIVKETCIKWKARVREFNAESDHCHIIVDYPPDIALTKLIANLKTVSSRYLRKEFPKLLDVYHKPVLWTASYFVASCGGVTVEQLKKYVQNQSRPVN